MMIDVGLFKCEEVVVKKMFSDLETCFERAVIVNGGTIFDLLNTDEDNLMTMKVAMDMYKNVKKTIIHKAKANDKLSEEVSGINNSVERLIEINKELKSEVERLASRVRDLEKEKN